MFYFKFRIYLILFFLFLTLFIGFSFLVTTGHFAALDQNLDKTMTVSSTSLLFWGSWLLAYLYLPLIVLLLSLFVNFLHNKNLFEAKMLFASASGFIASELVFKPLFQITCPDSHLGQLYSFREVFNLPFLNSYALKYPCYPSGHTTSYVVFFGYLALLSFLYLKNKTWRWLVFAITFGVIILIGPSRIYLHVHWLSDVIAGYFLGIAILSGLIMLRYKHDQNLINQRSEKKVL